MICILFGRTNITILNYRYDDLKPPTSPRPKAPGDVKDVLASTATVADTDGVNISESVSSIPEHSPGVGEKPKERPLSPYAA